MKKVIALLLALVMLLSMAACGTTATTKTDTTAAADTTAVAETTTAEETTAAGESVSAGDQGKVFNIYAWNEEFKGFFEKYYTVPEGVTVNWIINPSDGGVYQDKLDEALLNQESASDDEKVDLFLAEADYILKYVDSDYTLDVQNDIGFSDLSSMYPYTIDAATDSSGTLKGVSFQCCPAALIYRRSIAKDVLGTDDPTAVQEALSSWDKFDEVAAKAKEKGYYMTASYVETYRTFSNNTSEPWVDDNGNLQFDQAILDYIKQADTYVKEGYTLTDTIWGDEKASQMFADGKTMCFFGPAWYYNFCMGNAQDAEKGCSGDWAICEGPQAYSWGGTWLLGAAGSDNTEMLKDIFETFTTNEDVCSKLVKDEQQFSNNINVNNKFASDASYGNEFLGGQNDTAVFAALAKNIKFENKTAYDQLLNEQLPSCMLDYFKGTITEEEAYANFYKYVNEKYPAIVTPK
ncbi:MAG: carbohydrate ABC transporter substrate-binding protein [Oscillospiraceae bacterium]|nr:carbohydrate ABC transporter substrate-binding protein [Oscillospiraceae bacterium]